jgi:phosphoribosylanthranilate isomerase
MTRIKVCGLTRVEDALAAVELGVDTLGLNFWPGTKRCVSIARAREIVTAVSRRAELVAVFVDADESTIRETLAETGITWAQLHGDEPPSLVEALLPNAYKALGVRDDSVRARAATYPGEHILLDAAVPGAMPGGTGQTFDWALATAIARTRKLTLAGGLHPDNVAEAVRVVAPYRVDVASGVESAPGIKDPSRMRAFIDAVRGAK